MSIIDKASLIQIPSGYKNGKLYSIKPNSTDGDFDFSRSSSATRVNSEGLIEVAQIVSTTEEVTNGDFSGVANGTDVVTLSGWGTYGSVTSRNIESEQLKLVSPLGTTNVGVVLSVSTTSGSLYRFTYSASGDLGVNGIYIDGVGAYNSSTEKNITFTATSSTTYIYFRPGENNGGTAYFDNISVKEVFENDVPRLDYSDGSCPSLLLEPQRTNLINYSQSLLGTNRAGTYTVNAAISPDGTQNATKITATTTDPFFYQSVTLNAATYTASLWVKGVGSSIGKEFRFAISNQTHVGNRYTIPSEWTRFEFTASVNAGSVTTGVEIPDPAVVGDEVLVWGWQVEESSFATSYIPSNSGSATTRVADVCNNAGTSATFSDSEGVLFAEIAALANNGTSRHISINDGTDANKVEIYYDSTTNEITGHVNVNGVSSALFEEVVTSVLNFNKVALKYKENDFSIFINGSKLNADTSGVTFSSNTLNNLSFDKGDGTLDFYGKTRQLITFNEALSSEELADLTGQVNTSFVQLANFYNYTIL